MTSLGTIINFCSNDYPFLRACIDGVKPFSRQILIPVCDHFFDGKPEEKEYLSQIYAENRDVEFIEFPFDVQKSLYGSHSSVYWHNLARLIGRFFLQEEVEYILFIDCDEIIDFTRFQEWLQRFPYREYEALQLLNYWYFRESRFQAKTWEYTPLLIRKASIDGTILMNLRERAGMYDAVGEKKQKGVAGMDGLPLIHHYSWVRTKEQLLRKVLSWSHNWQRDWVSEVEKEFSHPFNGVDFVHGYAFTEVTPFVSIDLEQKPPCFSSCDFSHVRRLSHEEVVKIDISLTYQIALQL